MAKHSNIITVLMMSIMSCPVRSEILFRNSTGMGCHIVADPVGTATIVHFKPHYVFGITALEFRIAGLPPSYSAVATPIPGGISVTGDPFSPAGCRVVFSECQQQREIDLFEVTFTDVVGSREEAFLVASSTAIPEPPDCLGSMSCNGARRCFTAGAGAVINGSTELETVTNPIPPDGAVDVNLDLRELTYELPIQSPAVERCIGTEYPMYFGTTPNPPGFDCYHTPLYWCQGLLLPNTTYYWRVDTVAFWGDDVAAGPLWSFTTGTYVSLKGAAWGTVKTLYR
jgi:hypothetical protein